MKELLAWGTLKNYFTTQKYVVRFLKQERKTTDIYLSQLNYAFVTSFERFVKTYKPATHRQHCTQNGAMKHIKRLRKVVNLAIKNGWLKDDPFKQFKLKFKKKDRVTLTADSSRRMNYGGLKRKHSLTGWTKPAIFLCSVATSDFPTLRCTTYDRNIS